MKGLEEGDACYIKGTITEVNPNGTYTVEFSTVIGQDNGGLIAMMVPTEDVIHR